MGDPIHVLQVGELPELATEMLRERFVLHDVVEHAGKSREANRDQIRGIATTGKAEVGRALIASLPKLAIISCLGAGSEGIDTQAAAKHRVAIATTSIVLAGDVADVAMGLILNLARDFAGADRFVRSGHWSAGRYPFGTSLAGARLGIVGLGNIGAALARRAASFDMEIGYHGRSYRPGIPWPYFAELADLARWCRFLTLCCPGGAATYRLVSADVLRALGSESYLVNVARGSVVDEPALAKAVSDGEVAGAGLDVFEDEPHPHPALLGSPRVTLLPHISSATYETRQKMAVAMVNALETALRSVPTDDFKARP